MKTSRDLVVAAIAFCLALAAAGGFAGATACEFTKKEGCLEYWKSATAGALGAIGAGGTLLARIEGDRPSGGEGRVQGIDLDP